MTEHDEIDPATHCPFPKHRGVRWDIVAADDRAYAIWLLSGTGPEMPEEMYNAIIDALEET